MVEQGTENPRVGSSILSLGTRESKGLQRKLQAFFRYGLLPDEPLRAAGRLLLPWGGPSRSFLLLFSSSSSSFLALLVLARRGGATRWRQSFRQRTACRMSGEWGPSLCAVAACPLWRAPCKGQKREGNVRLLPAPCAGVFVVIRPAGDRRRQARGMSSPPKTRTSPSSRHRRSRSRTAPGP